MSSDRRKLAAILSADVRGYSRLMADDEAATVGTLTAHRRVFTQIIEQHHGRVIDSPGDNLLAEFGSAVNAVQGAVEVQRELRANNSDLPEHRRMAWRIGINLGDVIFEDERIYGDGVNVAARIEGIAEPGGVCVSRSVYDQVKGKLAFGFEYLGEHGVKNIAEPVRVYRVELKTVQPAWGGDLKIPDKPSIAVLPFVNLGGDPAQEFMADGLSDNIITALSQIPEMFVIARTSSFVYKGRPVKVQDVGRDLGVRYVLEGSVQPSGERVRVHAQLIDTTTGHHIWAERYYRGLEDLMAIQDEITLEIVGALQRKLTDGEAARYICGSTRNLEAWGATAKAMGHFFCFTREDNLEARRLCKRATDLDPDYPFAWLLLAWTFLSDAAFGHGEQRAEAFKRAVEAAKQGIGPGRTVPEYHSLLAFIYLFHGQHDQALAEAERGVALGPSSYNSQTILGYILMFLGRFEEAIDCFNQVRRLSPYASTEWWQTHLGEALGQTGRHEEAVAVYEELIADLERRRRRSRRLVAPHLGLAANYVWLGQEEKARRHAGEVLKLNPKFRLDNLRKWSFYKDETHLERILEALRRAGLK